MKTLNNTSHTWSWGIHRAFGAIAPPKTYESNLSNFIYHDFVQFGKQHIRDIRTFFRPLFCHSNVVKYASSLLQ